MRNILIIKTLLYFLILFCFTSCAENYTPKPRGYFRIALPEKKYVKLDSIYPYSFEYPVYAKITNDPLSPQQKNWITINFPQLKGSLHVSYKPIKSKADLNVYIEDSRALALKHMPKSSGINYIRIEDNNNKIYGLAYDIKGSTAASPYQFYLTDSTRHFLRASLYFETIPNNDSLQPVIQFVKKDIEHLVETMKWKN